MTKAVQGARTITLLRRQRERVRGSSTARRPGEARRRGSFRLRRSWRRSCLNQVTAPLATAPQKEYGYRGGKLLIVWDGTQAGDDQLKWLVTDQLGSTRMEANRSGSLAGIRRHDYLPFGEELVASTGAQRGGIGYEPPQSAVRQRFDGYERDSETGLDFAEARYFASM